VTLTIHRMNEGLRATLIAHFLALSTKDRHLRFGTPFGLTAIASYVDRIDFDHDAVFGVHDDRQALVGAAHLAMGEDVAELALSVLPDHRCQGVGTALFRRAAAYARKRSAARLFMHCLSSNAPIMRIAWKFGMVIVAGSGDVDAYLKLQPAALETQETN
jgi:GNAT superfamily N-acetyltransferase